MVDAPVGLDPVVLAIGATHPVLVRVGAATPQHLAHGGHHPWLVVGVDGGDDLLGAQAPVAEFGVEAEGRRKGLVDGDAVGRQVPVPGADDGARRQRQLHALGVLAGDLLARAQSLLGLAPVGDVVEEDGDLSFLGLAHADGAHVEPAAEGLGIALEGGGLARPRHPAIGLEPEGLQVGRELGHPLAPQVHARLALEGRVGLHEAVVHGPVVGVELHLHDGEGRIHRLQQGREAVLGVAQALHRLHLHRAVAHDLHVAPVRAAVLAQRHHLARGPEPAAVLAHVPAFVAGAAIPGRLLHLQGDTVLGQVLGREDAFGRGPHHLVAPPAEDVLRARVPVGDPAVEVRHDHREVDRAVDDVLQMALLCHGHGAWKEKNGKERASATPGSRAGTGPRALAGRTMLPM